MNGSSEPSTTSNINIPSVDDLENFIPYVCKAFEVPEDVLILKETDLYNIVNKKGSKKPIQKASGSWNSNSTPKDNNYSAAFDEDKLFYILKCVYDTQSNFVKLKLENNKTCSRKLFKVINLVLPYHKHVYSIWIRGGMNIELLQELKHILNIPTITDICLDDSYINGGPYEILLDPPSNVHYLSLCRCGITDETVIKIAEKLEHLSYASNTLCTLNLSSNLITAIGCKYLAHMLRTNRKLNYLNLSNNRLDDDGAIYILNSLMNFPLTYEEVIGYRQRLLQHYITVSERVIRDPEIIEKPKHKAKVKIVSNKSEKNIAKNIKQEIPFHDPFAVNEIVIEDDTIYSLGNNAIKILNLAYNDLTMLSLKKILEVVNCQLKNDRNPRGLISLNIDGNFLPVTCIEMLKINETLGNELNATKANSTRKISKF